MTRTALDRRTLLKTAAVSAVLAAPALARAQETRPSPREARRMRPAAGGGRLLSRPTVELMTADHLTPAQKAASPFFPNFWDNRGWGFGLSVITRRDNVFDVPGRFGWDGGYGTSFYVDPQEELIGVLMCQRLWDPSLLALHHDFWTKAYLAIDD